MTLDHSSGKTYKTPTLTAYGKVSQLTQGTGSMGNDGGGVMTMN